MAGSTLPHERRFLAECLGDLSLCENLREIGLQIDCNEPPFIATDSWRLRLLDALPFNRVLSNNFRLGDKPTRRQKVGPFRS
jgi:hypothetical protein